MNPGPSLAAAFGTAAAPAPLSLLFLSGTAANVREGSGTYVGISVLRRALLELGCAVELVAPQEASSAWRRFWFNRGLRGRDLGGFDAVVGFDWDGAFLPAGAGRPWQVAAIKGVLAEEARFERVWPRLSLGLQAVFEGRCVRRASRVLATSRYAAAAIARHYRVPAERIRIVAEPIELADWTARLATAPTELRPYPSILCVAHLYPRKEVSTLLYAMAQLRSTAQARIVGDGPEGKRLRRLAQSLGLEERVEFLGHVPLARLAQEYRNADIFCLPSRQEGFGIVLLEAMAAGLPIVAARAAAIPEVVPENRCGLLFPPGDAGALAGQIERLLADSGAARELGAQGRAHVVRYDASRIATEFLAALR